MDRLIEAEARADHGRDLLGSLGRDQDVGGIPWHHLHEQEDDERHAEQDRHSIKHAACNEAPHKPSHNGARGDRGKRLGCPAYLIHTRVRSWNQLCALTKPWTCLVMARGLRSWTIHNHGASSTRISCIAAMALRNSSWLLASSILRSNASNSELRQWPQFEPLGVALSP